MPRPPIFESERAQHTAIAIAMAGVLLVSVLMAWLISGASLRSPFGPTATTAPHTTHAPAQPEPRP